MLKAKYKNYVSAVLLVFGCLFLYGQNEISSPYSKYGFGLPSNVTSGAYDAMGKVGYAMQNPYLINFKNPASYVAFDSLSFIADVAFSIYSSTLKTSDVTQQATYARPAYFTFGLPVTKHWRTSVGILPFSNLGYSIIDSKKVGKEQVDFAYNGKGGLMQLYWGNAFKLCKGLSIGFNVSYLWGSLSYTKTATYDASGNFFNTMVSNSTDADGIYYSVGAQYFVNIKGKHRLGFGAVYENSAYIWTKETQFTYNYTSLGNNNILNDSVAFANAPGSMKIPQTIGGGISYQFKEKLWASADVAWMNYGNYQMNGQRIANLQDAITVNAGLQFIPDINSSNYMKKIRLRIGGRYSTGQIMLNDQSISDFSVSLGLGFPLKLYSNNSSLGLMFEYGQMGTIKNNLLKENYFRFSLHFTLQEKWYQRVKLD